MLEDLLKTHNDKESQMKLLKNNFIAYKEKGGNDPDGLDLQNLLFTDGYEVPLNKIHTIKRYV
jgi:hypothetical protein